MHRALWVGIIALLCSGCGKSKIDQCNAFIDEGNKSQNAFVAIEAAMLNAESFKKRTDQIDASMKALKAVELPDAKLAGMRDKYVEGLQGFSTTLAKLVAMAKDPSKEADVDKLEKEIETISDKESKLIDEINAYCGGK